MIGLDGFIQDIIEELPSTSGKELQCGSQVGDAFRAGLTSCMWNGLGPNVMADIGGVSPVDTLETHDGYALWLSYNVTHANNTAQFSIQGRNTKQCRLVFDNMVSDVQIDDAASDPRYEFVADGGSSQIRLFSRTWDKRFQVNVTWSGPSDGQTGKVMCMWSDANQLGTIPAFDEARRFAPVWSAITKTSDGLVEGFKEFKLRQVEA